MNRKLLNVELQRYEIPMRELELHPLCTLFPRLTGADFDALRDDIAANGLRQPIVTYQGMILDGGNRFRACLAANVTPTFTAFAGDDPTTFVLSSNLHRRHMSAGQRASIVSLAANWARSQTHGGNRKLQGEALHLESVAERAAKSGATTRTQKDADKLAKNHPDVAQQVADGKKSLYQAAKDFKPTSKVMPRPTQPEPAKPAKNAPTIESLQAEVESLRGELKEAHDIARDLAHQLESYESASGDVKAAAKELTTLKGMLHTVETQRDSYMTKCNEMVKSVNYWKRKAGGAK